MLKWRLLSAAVMIAGLLALLHVDYHHPLVVPGVWLLPLALLATVLMVGELLHMWNDRPDQPVAWPVYAGCVLVLLSTSLPLMVHRAGTDTLTPLSAGPLAWTLVGLAAGLGLAFFGQMARYSGPGHATGAVALSALAVLYVGLLPSFLILLRLFRDSASGMGALLSLIIVVKVSDTGAYFTGRMWGRHRLAPLLSPGKTIEGVVGGLVSAILAAAFCFVWLFPRTLLDQSASPWWGWVLFAIVVTLAGIAGDLAESLLKRDSGRKDSSSWLPGLGGVLDVMDSLLFAAPAAYACWALGLVGG